MHLSVDEYAKPAVVRYVRRGAGRRDTFCAPRRARSGPKTWLQPEKNTGFAWSSALQASSIPLRILSRSSPSAGGDAKRVKLAELPLVAASGPAIAWVRSWVRYPLGLLVPRPGTEMDRKGWALSALDGLGGGAIFIRSTPHSIPMPTGCPLLIAKRVCIC